jgi:hypothetical protein
MLARIQPHDNTSIDYACNRVVGSNGTENRFKSWARLGVRF